MAGLFGNRNKRSSAGSQEGINDPNFDPNKKDTPIQTTAPIPKPATPQDAGGGLDIPIVQPTTIEPQITTPKPEPVVDAGAGLQIDIPQPTVPTPTPADPITNVALNRLQASQAASELATAQRLGARQDLTAGAKTAIQATQKRDAQSALSEATAALAIDAQNREDADVTQAVNMFDNFVLTKLEGGEIDPTSYINDSTIRANAKQILGAGATEQQVTDYIRNSFQGAINSNRDKFENQIDISLANMHDNNMVIDDALTNDSIRRKIALLNGITDINSSSIDDIITAKWGRVSVTGVPKMIQNMVLNDAFSEDLLEDPNFETDITTWAQGAFQNGFLIADGNGGLAISETAPEGFTWPWNNPDTMFNYTSPNGNDLNPGETVNPTEVMTAEGNGTTYFTTDNEGNKVAVTQGDVEDQWQNLLNTDPMSTEDYLKYDSKTGSYVLNQEKFMSEFFSDQALTTTIDKFDFLDNVPLDSVSASYDVVSTSDTGQPIYGLTVQTPDGEATYNYNTPDDKKMWAAVSNEVGKALSAEEYAKEVAKSGFLYDPENGTVTLGGGTGGSLPEAFATPTLGSDWGSVDLNVNWDDGGKGSVAASYNDSLYNRGNKVDLRDALKAAPKGKPVNKTVFTFTPAAKSWVDSNIDQEVIIGGQTYTLKGIDKINVGSFKDTKGGTRMNVFAEGVKVVDQNGNETVIPLDKFDFGWDSKEGDKASIGDDGTISFG